MVLEKFIYLHWQKRREVFWSGNEMIRYGQWPLDGFVILSKWSAIIVGK